MCYSGTPLTSIQPPKMRRISNQSQGSVTGDGTKFKVKVRESSRKSQRAARRASRGRRHSRASANDETAGEAHRVGVIIAQEVMVHLLEQLEQKETAVQDRCLNCKEMYLIDVSSAGTAVEAASVNAIAHSSVTAQKRHTGLCHACDQ